MTVLVSQIAISHSQIVPQISNTFKTKKDICSQDDSITLCLVWNAAFVKLPKKEKKHQLVALIFRASHGALPTEKHKPGFQIVHGISLLILIIIDDGCNSEELSQYWCLRKSLALTITWPILVITATKLTSVNNRKITTLLLQAER
ncbi:hypothetical protein O181_099049 [Austropuccinia psidii MF-1]|uniref:Uncharacterized protein n=1 Tax=Austropuccinia psidii MF-1 TaxID=1389203 RepID=A0A9Q3JBY7_9BASI|nr:hypothetical protein [Austropuccinia psidii MF-1]